MVRIFITILVFTSFYNLCLAQGVRIYNIHQDYLGIRPMGMGNAYAAVADDYHTLYYNPAGLAWRKDGEINVNLIKGAATFGDNYPYDLYREIKNTDDISDADEQKRELVRIVKSHYGKNYNGRVMSPSFIWVRPGWGVGLIPADAFINVKIVRATTPALGITINNDVGLTFGFARKIEKLKGLSWGFAVKAIYRVNYQEIVLAIDALNFTREINKSLLAEGGTVDVDFGLLYKLPPEILGIKWNYAVVVRNIIDYGFYDLNWVHRNIKDPPRLQRRFDFGLQAKFKKFLNAMPILSFDLRDVGHSNWSLKKGVHAGGEMYWHVSKMFKIALRAGINQGFITYGASLKILTFLLEYVHYGEELGTKDVIKSNRVHMARVSLHF